MNDCHRIAELVTPYVDGELLPASVAELQRHVGACSSCRRGVAEEQAVRAALRQCAEALREPPLPPGLRSRCDSLLAEQRTIRRRAWAGRVVQASVVVVLLVAGAVLALPALTRQSGTVLAAQLAVDHVKCFKVFAQPSVTAEAGDVERLLSDFGWQMRVPASSSEHGLRLLGGRWCLYSHGKIPHVLYEAGDQQVSLFRLDGHAPPPGEITVFGHRALVWHRGAYTFVLIGSEKAGPTLTAVSRYIEQEAH